MVSSQAVFYTLSNEENKKNNVARRGGNGRQRLG